MVNRLLVWPFIKNKKGRLSGIVEERPGNDMTDEENHEQCVIVS